MARKYQLTDEDLEVMERASRLETGGIAAFTSYYFSPTGWTPRWDLVWKDQEAVKGIFSDAWNDRVNPDNYPPVEDLVSNMEYVPWVPFSWQAALAHDDHLDVTIIASVGTGKTIGVGAIYCYWASMTPGYKAMNAAPLGWQAKQMYELIKQELVDWDNRDTRHRPIHNLIVKFVEKPWPKIVFYNGSTIEFMSVDEQGGKLYSWGGDVMSLDESDKLELAHSDLEEVIGNIGTRMRGASHGRARSGKLIVMGNAGIDPELWERFDMAEELPRDYLSIGLTVYDNPLLTKRQIRAMENRMPDPEKRKQMLLNERPLPRGKEFTRELLEPCRSESMDELMRAGLERRTPGYEREEMHGAGVVKWVLPYNQLDHYILVGDPGQNTPPARNSAVAMIIKCTGFPMFPAELAAFHWVDGRGSYWPFMNQMTAWYRQYRPIYSAFDATGTQKGFDELYFTQEGILIEGMNLQYRKKQMVLTLKLILGKKLLLMPSGIQGIWLQLAGWRLPDTKLKQDIASTLFMAADVLNRLFTLDVDDAASMSMEEDYGDGSLRDEVERLTRREEIERLVR